MPDQLDQIDLRDGASICDSQLRVLYYQRTPKGLRGDFGASFNRSPQHGSGNFRELHRVYPALRGVPIGYDSSGPIDCVPGHVPVFGRLASYSNVLFGMGFSGTGIA